jgi:hypothetical protein
MLYRLILVLTLSLLFGLGQQGAAAHAISHWADEQNQSQQDNKDHHLSFCDKCVVYAALDSAADSSPIAFAPQATDQIHFNAADTHPSSSHVHYYAARAPPRLV